MSKYDHMTIDEIREESARQDEENRKMWKEKLKNMTPEEREKYDRGMEDDHLFLKMNSGIGPEGGGPSPLLEEMLKNKKNTPK